MDIFDLISKLGNITISPTNINDIIQKIIIYMYESAEEGKNNYTYYFNSSNNVELIINILHTYFPDLHIDYKPDNNYIFIDWS
jgi:hypothetical protein